MTGTLAAGVALATEGGGASAGPGPVATVAVVVLLAVGTFFLFVGTFGLIRLPKVYNRMHATTKATTLGASSVALAGFVYFGPGGDGLLGLVTVAFLFLTAPTGAHLISRAAQRMGVSFVEGVTWPRSETDEDRGEGPGAEAIDPSED
ncbi:MAG: monovalent cation/H(+) antiporter subunit G [Haloferacaceae archaeon]